MTRRGFLQLLGAIGVVSALPAEALRLAAEDPAAPADAAFERLFDNELFTISFPDGATYRFSGTITSLSNSAPVDGLTTTSVSVRPTGPVEIVERRRPEAPQAAISTGGVTIERGGESVGELIEVCLPHAEQSTHDFDLGDGRVTSIPGLRRTSDLTFTVAFDEEKFEALVKEMKG